MERTVIQKHSTSLVKNLIDMVKSLSTLQHELTKGELRELFVANILDGFLTTQFEIGSGIITNQRGEQSNQTDILIYDNRILPPFIRKQNLGVYPAESVIATIEVKSWLDGAELSKAEESARKLHEEVYNPTSSLYGDYKYLRPLCAVIGFFKKGLSVLAEKERGEAWLRDNVKYLFAICLVGEYSWINLKERDGEAIRDKWRFEPSDEETNEETKRFIAVTLDNVRTYSEGRFRFIWTEKHKDWLGLYIRDQEAIKRHFDSIKEGQ